MAVLDINDCGISLIDSGQVRVSSPGYLHLSGKQHLSGVEARQRHKLEPSASASRFWQDLGQSQVELSASRPTTQADLAWLHLGDLWQQVQISGAPSKLLLTVPSDYSREQIGLLLGMAQHLGVPVIAVADSAQMSAPAPVAGQTLIHLGLHLHRTVMTALSQGQWLESKQVQTTTGFSLIRCMDRWQHAVASRLIRNTRFDPMHHANTEQQLFDQIPSVWDDSLSTLTLNHDGGRFELQLDRSSLEAECATMFSPLLEELTQFYRQIGVSGQVTLMLDHHFRVLPGLRDALSALPNTHVLMLEETAVEQGLKRLYMPRNSSGQATTRVTKLPWFNAEDQQQHVQAHQPKQQNRPTHVLYQSRAYPLNGEAFVIGSAAQLPVSLDIPHLELGGRDAIRLHTAQDQIDLNAGSDDQILLNGHPARGQVSLTAGDRLRIGAHGPELSLIIVEAEHGSA